MERKKYLLILFILLKLFFLKGLRCNSHDLDICPMYQNVCHARFISVIDASSEAPTQFKKIIYDAFVNDKMEKWEEAIITMEKEKINDTGYLLELINYQYGYTAWCLGNNKKDKAEIFLNLLENNLEKLQNNKGKTSEYHAFKAASYGFKIGLNRWRAPFLGPKSMEHAEQAIEKDSMNMQANMEMGNIWNNMPKMFGGSKDKALHYYLKALNIMENKDPDIRKNNWIYLNLLVLAGQTEKELGNKQSAIEYYEKTLEIEPGFTWVKDKLLPSLLNE
jgi:tetratricopeptide (TPR) repeat protein